MHTLTRSRHRIKGSRRILSKDLDTVLKDLGIVSKYLDTVSKDLGIVTKDLDTVSKGL